MLKFFRERPVVVALFCVWLAHLLAYAWLVPPWQHYDEPTHFEYAALIRDLGRLPTLDEQIPSLRRAIAASMVEHGFFQRGNMPLNAPDLGSSNLSLGINERGHPPLYYVLVAISTWPFRALPIEAQLRAARCVSVALAALLFPAAYLLLKMLTGTRWELRCAVLAALALQPAFADNMSSVNSDVLANVVAVLMLLVGVAVVRRPEWRWALASVLVVLLAWNVKRTLLIYSLVVPVAWLLAAPRAIKRGFLLAGAVCAALGLVWLAIQPWPLADWDGSPPTLAPTSSESRAGKSAFVLDGVETNMSLSQRVYPYRLHGYKGQRLTFGAWMRANQPVTTHGPVLEVGTNVVSQTVSLDTTWRLITTTTTLTDDHASVTVRLPPPPAPATVYADSLALVVGETALPGENEPDGSYEPGVLGPGEPRNLIRNAGAERHVPPLPAAFESLVGRMFDQASLAQTLSTLSNPRWIAAVYPRQIWLLFSGAWGTFGWGQYAVGPGWFTPLAIMVVTSIIGSILELRRLVKTGEGSPWQVRAWWLCIFAVALGWGTALIRVHNQPFPGTMFWSFGRYTFVAMLPSLLFFVVGFRAAFPASLRTQATVAQLAFLMVFALVGLSVAWSM